MQRVAMTVLGRVAPVVYLFPNLALPDGGMAVAYEVELRLIDGANVQRWRRLRVLDPLLPGGPPGVSGGNKGHRIFTLALGLAWEASPPT